MLLDDDKAGSSTHPSGHNAFTTPPSPTFSFGSNAAETAGIDTGRGLEPENEEEAL